MKHLPIIFFFLFITQINSAQAFRYSNNFDGTNTDSLLRLGEEENNIWQIGVSSKNIFSGVDSAEYPYVPGYETGYGVLDPPSIMTDTTNSYTTNNISSFEIEYGHEIFKSSNIFFYVEFVHNFQTDKGQDGGTVELSYDGGLNWQNILEITYNSWSYTIGFYTKDDTIVGGAHGFTGESEDWKWSMVQWTWGPLKHPWMDTDSIDLKIRFLFISDSIENNKAGWIIDNIFLTYSSTESIEENELKIPSKVFPNPINSESILRFDRPITESLIIEIYSVQGTIIKSTITNENQIPIYKSEFEPGIYFYRMRSLEIPYYGSGKFIVN